MNVEESFVWKKMPPEARALLESADSRLRIWSTFQSMWDRLLTAPQREQLGSDPQQAFRELGSVGLWMRVYGVTNRFAALHALESRLQLCWQPAEREWIGQHVSLAASPPLDEECPSYDPMTGELFINGEMIRKLRLTGTQTNISRILMAFHNSGFPKSVEYPLSRNAPSGTVEQSVDSLNTGLSRIRFRSREAGRYVYWERR